MARLIARPKGCPNDRGRHYHFSRASHRAFRATGKLLSLMAVQKLSEEP
jgi:hypothetical protein